MNINATLVNYYHLSVYVHSADINCITSQTVLGLGMGENHNCYMMIERKNVKIINKYVSHKRIIGKNRRDDAPHRLIAIYHFRAIRGVVGR